MNSNYIKASIFAHMRFKKQVHEIASECGGNNADILFIKKELLFEIEIKTSKVDFNNDFKKPKHENYLENKIPEAFTYNGYDKKLKKRVTKIHKDKMSCKPNYFCFAVPEDMQYYALSKIENTPYGLFIISKGIIGENIKTIVKPRLLHDRKVDDYARRLIHARTASELANFWINKIKDKK